MKFRTLQLICSAICVAALPVIASPASRADTYARELKAIRAAELPNHAASLVSKAAPAERAAVAADVVAAAIHANASSTRLVVGAIARSHPDVAAIAAGTAASAQPKMAAAVARAAVSAAPESAEAVVVAVCKAVPGAFYAVGVAAAEAAPKAGAEILRGISTAVPALKHLIAQASADLAAAKSVTSVAFVLKRADVLLKGLAKTMKTSTEALLAGEVTSEFATKLASVAASVPPPPPVIGPPATPGGASSGEITTADTYEAPPSGREYSAP